MYSPDGSASASFASIGSIGGFTTESILRGQILRSRRRGCPLLEPQVLG
jgi:hypothetical protein